MTDIPQANHQDKAPTTDYPRELQQLTAVRDTLVDLPCSPQIKPIVSELSEILGLAHDGEGLDVDRLRILAHTTRAKG